MSNWEDSILKIKDEHVQWRLDFTTYLKTTTKYNGYRFFWELIPMIYFTTGKKGIAWTDANCNIFLNIPHAEVELKNTKWEFIYYHECLHQLFETFEVGKALEKEQGKKFSHFILNVASDCIINNHIKKNYDIDYPTADLITPEYLLEKYNIEYNPKEDNQYDMYMKLYAIKDKFKNDPIIQKALEDMPDVDLEIEGDGVNAKTKKVPSTSDWKAGSKEARHLANDILVKHCNAAKKLPNGKLSKEEAIRVMSEAAEEIRNTLLGKPVKPASASSPGSNESFGYRVMSTAEFILEAEAAKTNEYSTFEQGWDYAINDVLGQIQSRIMTYSMPVPPSGTDKGKDKGKQPKGPDQTVEVPENDPTEEAPFLPQAKNKGGGGLSEPNGNDNSNDGGDNDIDDDNDIDEMDADDAAESAQKSADAAKDAAEKAKEAAGSAQNSDTESDASSASSDVVKQAKEAADKAKKAADEAQKAADKAQKAADKAKDAAKNGNKKEAQKQAKEAGHAAKDAQQQKNEAVKNSNESSNSKQSESSPINQNNKIDKMSGDEAAKSAQKSANEAKKSANAAKQSADEARQLADTASDNSDGSSGSLSKKDLEKAAEKAERAAAKAQEAADRAQEAADKAKSAAAKGDEAEAKNQAKEAAKQSDDARKQAQNAAENDNINNMDGTDDSTSSNGNDASKKPLSSKDTPSNDPEKATSTGEVIDIDANETGTDGDEPIDWDVDMRDDPSKPAKGSTIPWGDQAAEIRTFAAKNKFGNMTAADVKQIAKRLTSGGLDSSLSDFVKKCKQSKKLESGGIIVKTTMEKKNASWATQFSNVIKNTVRQRVHKKLNEWRKTYNRPNRRQGVYKDGDPLKKGKIREKDRLTISLAYYIDVSYSMKCEQNGGETERSGKYVSNIFKYVYTLNKGMKKQYAGNSVVEDCLFKIIAFNREYKEIVPEEIPMANGGTEPLLNIVRHMKSLSQSYMINVIITDGGMEYDIPAVKAELQDFAGNIVFITNDSNLATVLQPLTSMSGGNCGKKFELIVVGESFEIDASDFTKVK